MNPAQGYKKPIISIVIICEGWNTFLEESLPYYKELSGVPYEVIVITTDLVSSRGFDYVNFIASPETKNNPAEKRDLAIKYAKGDWLAFIDDDAYPSNDWLSQVAKYLNDKDIAAIGGPGITPENTGLLEKVSGWVSASPLGGYGVSHRFIPEKQKYVDDYPSMNLIVRFDDFKKVGGFDSSFYPGEDTKLCSELVKLKAENGSNKKIVYDPGVVVYHHKRPLFKKHLIQNGRFGLHRGHFAKILPETSRRWFYFIPSVFLVGNILGLYFMYLYSKNPSVTLKFFADVYLYCLLFYYALLFLNSLWVYMKSKDLMVSLTAIPGVLLTHLWYGFKFLQGYLFVNGVRDNYGRSE